MPRTPMITPYSAALMLQSFVQREGREPKIEKECNKHNGLPHFTTLYQLFSNFRVSTAIAAISSLAPASSVRMTTCLRCDTPIKWEGPHVRHCEPCRRWLNKVTDGSDESYTMHLTFEDDDDDRYSWAS